MFLTFRLPMLRPKCRVLAALLACQQLACASGSKAPKVSPAAPSAARHAPPPAVAAEEALRIEVMPDGILVSRTLTPGFRGLWPTLRSGTTIDLIARYYVYRIGDETLPVAWTVRLCQITPKGPDYLVKRPDLGVAVLSDVHMIAYCLEPPNVPIAFSVQAGVKYRLRIVAEVDWDRKIVPWLLATPSANWGDVLVRIHEGYLDRETAGEVESAPFGRP